MTDKHFTAILAKNDIAREIINFNNGEPISVSKVLACLCQIEEYIGQANQPSVDDIINESLKPSAPIHIVDHISLLK